MWCWCFDSAVHPNCNPLLATNIESEFESEAHRLILHNDLKQGDVVTGCGDQGRQDVVLVQAARAASQNDAGHMMVRPSHMEASVQKTTGG